LPNYCLHKLQIFETLYIMVEGLRLETYVKGAEPDRWHWMSNCKQYPRVVMERRTKRPTSDLCDECLEIEEKALRHIPAV